MVLLALAENSLAVNWASNDLQEGGLHRHMNDLDLARQGMCQKKLMECEPLKLFAGVAPGSCILTKLGAHGPCVAWKSKRLIAEFSEVPFGNSLITLNKALKNLYGT